MSRRRECDGHLSRFLLAYLDEGLLESEAEALARIDFARFSPIAVLTSDLRLRLLKLIDPSLLLLCAAISREWREAARSDAVWDAQWRQKHWIDPSSYLFPVLFDPRESPTPCPVHSLF